MVFCYQKCFYIFALILYCYGQPVFDCPKYAAFGDNVNLSCYNIKIGLNIDNPNGDQVATCVGQTCAIRDERVIVSFMKNNTVQLTVREIGRRDEGEWTCQSVKSATCFLNVYKTPTCTITSNISTNDLRLGQELILNINLSDYYCTESIAWNFQINGISQNIEKLQEPETTKKITSRTAFYSSTVTSSLTGHVQMVFVCNQQIYELSCFGVKELQLQEATSEGTNTLLIGLPTGSVVCAFLFGILWKRKRRKPSSNEVSVYNIPTSYNDEEERYEDLIRDVGTPSHVPDANYLNPVPSPDTQNNVNADYEGIDDNVQVELEGRRTRTIGERGSERNEHKEYLSAVFNEHSL